MENLDQCIICHKSLIVNKKDSQDSLFLESVDALVSNQTFRIEKCYACCFLYTNPRPNKLEIKKYYRSDAYISHTENKQTLMEWTYFQVQKIMFRRKISLLKKHTKPQSRKILDYGCGTGNFMQYARQNGFMPVGYEPETHARRKAEAKSLDLKSHDEIMDKSNTEKYDIITLWHVLEHLHSFPEILNDFYTKLNPHGLLVIAVPMANSSDAKYYKKFWAGWDLPRHLYHFTRKSLVGALKTIEYELITTKGMPFDSYYMSLLSEQNKGSRMSYVRAFFIGSWSNLMALLGKAPWSSEIFVFRKKPLKPKL